MMSSAPAATTKDETQGSGGRKTPSAARQGAEQGLKCPRCDSPNTKFCYYNNYSLTQPRHFCKTCRRYWTKGGALRNVPIGGGCRKNKKVKSSSRFSSMDCKDSGGSFFHHSLISPSSSSSSSCMDFPLGSGIPLPIPFPRLQNQNHHPHMSSSFGEGLAGSSGFNLDTSASAISNSSSLIGLNNYPFNHMGGGIQGMSSNSVNLESSLASSIESLSCINQDLHWKLQQQRLATLLGGDSSSSRHNDAVSGFNVESQKRQPLLFQNLEISNSKLETEPQEICAVGGNSRALPTEWFFGGSSYPSSLTPTPTASSAAAADANANATATATANGNDNGSITNNWTTGLHAWNDVHQQYSALP